MLMPGTSTRIISACACNRNSITQFKSSKTNEAIGIFAGR
jgi:hypothetical protein